MSEILLIDDDKALCRSLRIQLKTHDHVVRVAHTCVEGRAEFDEKKPQIVLLDLTLPDGSGLEVLDYFHQEAPEIPVVMITGKQDMNATITAMRSGAADYMRKPYDLDDLLLILEKLAYAQKQKKNSVHVQSDDHAHEPHEIIGSHVKIVEVIKQVGLLSQTRVTVLIIGESGTGKELVARALHDAGSPDKPFVALNCSAVVPTLFESELFGHEKGSFTGADKKRTGKMENAGEGTLFLDEIGDMPLDLQAKLLRVIQEEEFERVGGTDKIPFKARLVAATNRDLTAMVKEGKFRNDLYYRLAVSPLYLPPLRDRREDIDLISEHLIHKIAKKLHRRELHIEEAALRRLRTYDWPGNIRELENVLTRAIALSQEDIITEAQLDFPPNPDSVQSGHTSESSEPITSLREMECRYVKKALDAMEWNISQTAKVLEISPTTLRKKISDCDLKQD